MILITSDIGTKRTCHDGLWMSALGGETDIRQLGRDVAFDPTETLGPISFQAGLGAISQSSPG